MTLNFNSSICKMTLNFNSRYAMKCNFGQYWIHNFLKFSGEACAQMSLEGPKKFSSLHLKHFLIVRQISRSFLTSKPDRSDISRNIPNFLHSLIISGMKCCTRNSSLRHYSDLKYKHQYIQI